MQTGSGAGRCSAGGRIIDSAMSSASSITVPTAQTANLGLDATQRRREHRECHRFALLHPAARACASVQNHRSPFAVSMRVLAYHAPPGTW